MTSDQPHFFEVNRTEVLTPLRVHLDAELPGPGYDHLVLEMVSDALSRLGHDGLFPNRVAVEIELDHIDERFFGDTSSTASDNIDIDSDSAAIRRAQPE